MKIISRNRWRILYTYGWQTVTDPCAPHYVRCNARLLAADDCPRLSATRKSNKGWPVLPKQT